METLDRNALMFDDDAQFEDDLLSGGDWTKQAPMWTAWLETTQRPPRMLVVDASPAAPVLRGEPGDWDRFDELAREWAESTQGLSSHSKAVMLMPYQQIIAMGEVAIPMLLARLRDEPDHWFWALSVLADEDPAQTAKSFTEARQRWLAWGKQHGFLPS